MWRQLLTALLLVRVAHSIIIRSSPSQIHLEQRIQTVTKTPPSFFFFFCFNVSGRHASGLICARKVPQKGTAKPLFSGLRESLWSAVCVNLRCKTTGDPGSSWGSFLFYFYFCADSFRSRNAALRFISAIHVNGRHICRWHALQPLLLAANFIWLLYRTQLRSEDQKEQEQERSFIFFLTILLDYVPATELKLKTIGEPGRTRGFV